MKAISECHKILTFRHSRASGNDVGVLPHNGSIGNAIRTPYQAIQPSGSHKNPSRAKNIFLFLRTWRALPACVARRQATSRESSFFRFL